MFYILASSHSSTFSFLQHVPRFEEFTYVWQAKLLCSVFRERDLSPCIFHIKGTF